ncbi:hypothetical protein ABFX02_07G020200 [Erythranthe guttata]
MIKLGLKSRSRRVVQESFMDVEKSKICLGKSKNKNRREEIGENWSDSCWESLPMELLREILVKVEESESNWPARKHVVACAGVCKSWREVMKEVVERPEVSGKITFPASVKQPGPRESLMQCFIKRNRTTHTYYLYVSLSQALADDGKFLLAARKCWRTTCTDYMISIRADDMSKGTDTYVGKLRSNFVGTKFVVYDGVPPHSAAKMAKSWSTRMVGSKQISPKLLTGNYAVAHISYELNVLGARGPRRMHCIMNAIPSSAIKPGGTAPTSLDYSPTNPFFRTKSDKSLAIHLNSQQEDSLILRNKSPRWHEQLQCWCLNFHGRVTAASVKNFQLVASSENGAPGPEHDKVILQFGKVGKDVFTMDYRFPLSAFQAFAICLSSFDTKIACE